MKKFQNKKSGFSMLELVVVMLIMGTLASIRISKMGGSDAGANKASVKSDIRGVIARINACYADKLNYTQCNEETASELGDDKIPNSKNNVITIGSTNEASDFPLITITNDMGTYGNQNDDYTLYYDADIHSGISTSPVV